ncbi:hypothetical protein [Fusibacter tunisiensis]|uniref:DUF4358 domain-containing protein n=1 Tax=Fusibacter tunisiensis TaxID=1008308 RepID=A0ABS2MP76_9FIRM|nr:hypothetical protein [Fusibacter tunisiensis]MBM7561183.1 hypothetical protein [Fusibacter tunisiensis]
MKKLVTLSAVLAIGLSMMACASETGNAVENPGSDLSVDEIITEITEDAGIETATMNTPLTEENFSWFMFADYVEGTEAVSADAMINAVAHSVVLARVPEDSDVEALKAEIEEKADPRKWICVEAQKIEVVVRGNLILLVMSSEEVVDAVVANFEALE